MIIRDFRTDVILNEMEENSFILEYSNFLRILTENHFNKFKNKTTMPLTLVSSKQFREFRYRKAIGYNMIEEAIRFNIYSTMFDIVEYIVSKYNLDSVSVRKAISDIFNIFPDGIYVNMTEGCRLIDTMIIWLPEVSYTESETELS